MLSFIVRFAFRRIYSKEVSLISKEIDDIYFAATPASLPPMLARKLLVSAEDHRAGKHQGFDLRAICRAAYMCLLFRRRQGGSTIAQQLVRVISGRYEYTMRRKIREIIVSCLVCEKISREKLPVVYLLVAYYGVGMKGYFEACKKLGFDPLSTDVVDVARVVARIKYPSSDRSTRERLDKIEARAEHITRLYHQHTGSDLYEYLEVASIFPVSKRIAYFDSSSRGSKFSVDT